MNLKHKAILALTLISICFQMALVGPAPAAALPDGVQSHITDMQKKGVRPRIVIFWASIGMGHFVAAQSIQKDILALYPNAEVILKDIRDFQNPVQRKFVSKWYDFATKNLPSVYDKSWKDYIERTSQLASPGESSVAKHHHPEWVGMYLKETKPTMIISAFSHATEVLIDLRDHGQLQDIPIAQVLTDFVGEPYFEKIGERIDMTFVPHPAIREKFIQMGLSPDKVITSGMPVAALAYEKLTADERSAFLMKEGLNPQTRTVLLVSGSAGVGDFETMVQSMARESNGSPLQIIAVCGRNQAQFEKLKALNETLGETYKNVTLLVNGLMPQPQLLSYMKSVDLIVTKSGGLSSSEIAVVGTPAIFLDINGGQEYFNAEFFETEGMAVRTNQQNQVGVLAQKILNDSELQRSMVAAQSHLRASNDPTAIARWALSQPHKPLDQPWVNPPHIGEKPVFTAEDARPGFNKALLLWDEKEVWNMRWSFTREETEEIFASFFLWDMRKLGMVELAALWDQARKGAKVRLILDGYAPAKWDETKIDPAVILALQEAGAEVRIFHPLEFSTDFLKRSHDKLMYFKSKNVATTGDRNMQNINFRMQTNKGKKGESYVSAELAVQGNAALDVKNYLEDVWTVAKPVDTSSPTREDVEKAKKNLSRYLAHGQQPEPGENFLKQMMPVRDIRFLHDDPRQKGIIQYTKQQIVPLIEKAKEFVRLTSPYARPIPEYTKALEQAHKQGAQVMIQTASLKSTDSRGSTLALSNMVDDLQAKGVEISQHNGPDFMHAKMLEIDHRYTVVISDNFNRRSGYNDLESGFLIDDEKFAEKAAEFQKVVAAGSSPFEKPKDVMSYCQRYLLKAMDMVPVLRRQF